MNEIYQVWLNLATGEFSKSWLKSDRDLSDEYYMKALPTTFKLIEYTCPNDGNFQFNNKMRIK